MAVAIEGKAQLDGSTRGGKQFLTVHLKKKKE